MSAARSRPAGGPGGAAAETPLLDRLLFYLLLAVLCARPLIAESFQRLELSFLSALGAEGGATPATSAWLDGLLLAASALVLLRGGGARRGGAWVVAAVALLGGAVLLSVGAASDKRLAANAGTSLLVGVLAGLALLRVLRARWMARVLIAALLASGGANAFKCVLQRAYEFRDTLEYWQEQQQTLRARGLDLQDPDIVNYERRLRSREAFGYLSHPNVAASCLMMALLVAGGALAGRLHRPPAGAEAAAALGVGVALCALLALGLWLTGSVGALLAAGAGAALLGLLGALGRQVSARAGRTTALLAAGYLALILAAAGYGLARGTLPHSSLAFRWHYWRAAVSTIPDAPLTGIGRGNFAAAFMRHKTAESPEEVRSPHNLWLALLVELGPLGLAAGLLLVAGCVRGALGALGPPLGPSAPQERLTAARLLPAPIGVLLVQALFAGEQLSVPAVALLWVVTCAAAWALCFLAAAWLLGSAAPAGLRPAWLGAGLAGAILACLLHNLISFALLTPAGLSVFVVCAAAAFGLRPTEAPRRQREPGAPASGPGGRPWPAAALLGLVPILGHTLLITVPTTRSQRALGRLRAAVGAGNLAGLLAAARRALEADPWDAAGARSAARAVVQTALHPRLSEAQRAALLREARRLAAAALARDPRAAGPHRLLATVAQMLCETYVNLARPDEALVALRQAARQWEQAVKAYPSDPRLRISAGRALFRLWQQTGRPLLARAAGAQLRAALDLDELRDPREVRRLRPAERQAVRGMLRQLSAGRTAPASRPG